MINKLFITSLLIIGLGLCANGQRIVVDSSSTQKYLIKPSTQNQAAEPIQTENMEDDLSFGDRAISIGLGIVNRLKARLNLDEAAESLKEKKEKLLGKSENEEEGD
ncbi:hypothetical protein [Ekhidna sp.]|uniref:hypothetical protein n=1 Tax=Ekhidna sp. TaxID=2608089 RepID=UPI003B508BCC